MLRFWELGPSPNSVKIRMALKYKGIEFETVPVDPADRGSVVAVSGQELAPVIEDRGIVLNDSEAILHYLDASYRDTPRLFPGDRAGRQAADAWKVQLDRGAVQSWLPVFLTAIGRRESFEPSAIEGFGAWLGEMDQALADADSFDAAGSAINDLRVAEWACYALPGPELVARSPLFGKVAQLFAVKDGDFGRLRTFLEPWNTRMG
jgi:glutathione S-transferase